MDQPTIHDIPRRFGIGGWQTTAACGAWASGDAESWDFMLTLGGTVTYRHGGHKLVHRAGDFVAIRPHTLNRWDVIAGARGQREPWDMIGVLCDPPPRVLRLLDWAEVAPGYQATRLSTPGGLEPVRQTLLTMLRYQQQLAPGWEALAMNLFEHVLLLCRMHNTRHGAGTDPRLLAAFDFIAAQLERRISVADLCRAAHLSRSHLHALFAAGAGVSPMQYVERHRIGVAKRLLQTSPLRIGEIAWRVGFEDQRHFSQRFRKHTGMAPREYRLRYRATRPGQV